MRRAKHNSIELQLASVGGQIKRVFKLRWMVAFIFIVNIHIYNALIALLAL